MSSAFPAHIADKLFFIRNPHRHFLARRYAEGDGPLPPSIALFADDGAGTPSMVNLVIVKRFNGGRVRLLFAVSRWRSLKSDYEIMALLRSRGIDPITLKRLSLN